MNTLCLYGWKWLLPMLKLRKCLVVYIASNQNVHTFSLGLEMVITMRLMQQEILDIHNILQLWTMIKIWEQMKECQILKKHIMKVHTWYSILWVQNSYLTHWSNIDKENARHTNNEHSRSIEKMNTVPSYMNTTGSYTVYFKMHIYVFKFHEDQNIQSTSKLFRHSMCPKVLVNNSFQIGVM